MQRRFIASALLAAGLTGCQVGDYVPPRPSSEPGPAHQREMTEGRPGIMGDLRWNIDVNDMWEPARASEPTSERERAEFKQWRESMSPSERQEFDDWRAWQEWKRKNPK